jgi:hypothetical protein
MPLDLRWVRWGLNHVDEVQKIASVVEHAWAQEAPKDKVLATQPIIPLLADIVDDCPLFSQGFGAEPEFTASHEPALRSEVEARGINWDRWKKILEIIIALAPLFFKDEPDNT